MKESDPLQNVITELRRGTLTLAVLGCMKQSHYGYALLQTLQKQKIAIEANTLYPLLRRLESQGLLVSNWDTCESRPRKYYTRNEKGQQIFKELLAEWTAMQQQIHSICREEHCDEQSD